MKLINLLIIVSSMCLSNLSAEESLVKPMKEIEVKELNFDDLPKESIIGHLAGVVEQEEGKLTTLFSDRIKRRRSPLLYPHAEDLAYINGALCHVGNYPQSVIYTVLEGPYYGTQTTMTYGGIVMYVNYDYELEYTLGGVVLHHFYSDSEIVTGSTQVIRFY